MMNGLSRVLFVNPAGEAYGSEQSMFGMLSAPRVFEAQVVCPAQGPLRGKIESLGIKVHSLAFSKHPFVRRPDWHLKFFIRFLGILRHVRPHAVVVNLDGNTPLVVSASALAGIPVIRYSRFEFRVPLRWLDSCAWRKCAAVICPSEHVRQQVLQWSPKHFHKRVYCLYESCVAAPVDSMTAAAVRAKLSRAGGRIIGFVGRIHRRKRLDTAIRALAEVRRVFAQTQMVVVGSHDGSEDGARFTKELQSLARALGLGEVVRFLGYQEDVPNLMAALDVCVLPSESESFGMVLAEAWTQGVPTVATDIAGCREITLASGGGLLFPLGDPVAMGRQIIRLLGDPAKAHACGEAGGRWVREHCNPKDYVNRFEALLAQVCG